MVNREVRHAAGREAWGTNPWEGREFGPGLGAWWKNSEIVAKLNFRTSK